MYQLSLFETPEGIDPNLANLLNEFFAELILVLDTINELDGLKVAPTGNVKAGTVKYFPNGPTGAGTEGIYYYNSLGNWVAM